MTRPAKTAALRRVNPEACLTPCDSDGATRVGARDWSIKFHPSFEAWADMLDQLDAEALLAAARVLRSEGPMLGKSDRWSTRSHVESSSEHEAVATGLDRSNRNACASRSIGNEKRSCCLGAIRAGIGVAVSNPRLIADDLFDEHQ